MVFCLRFVDDNLEVDEEFIGLYTLDSTSAELIFATNILLHMLLRIENCRGQCFTAGVAAKITRIRHCALYTHCWACSEFVRSG